MPKVSIITTTYKHQDFIAQTIESVLDQSYTNRELLIGDDSPDDPTREIIQNYVQKYPEKIKARHHHPNKGIVDNMNFLIQQSSQDAEYISFLEGDDLYRFDNLTIKMDIFEKNSSVMLIYNNSYKINTSSEKIEGKNNIWTRLLKPKKKVISGIKNRKLVDFLKNGNPLQSFGVVIINKKIFLNKYYPLENLDKSSKMFGPLDYATWLRIIPNEQCYYSDEEIFFYRIHENNFVKNENTMYYQFSLIYEDIKLRHKDDNGIQNICNFFLENNAMMMYFLDGSNLKAITHALRSFKYNITSLFFERIAIIILSIIPRSLTNLFINRYKQL